MFFDRFEVLCKEKGFSKQKACLDCGLSRTAWNKWKAGAVPNGEALQNLADYFNVSVDYLLGKEDTKKAPPKADAEITFDDFTYALLDETEELTEDNKQKLLEMAKFFKSLQDKEKNKGD